MNPAPLQATNVPSAWWISRAARTRWEQAQSPAPPTPMASATAGGVRPAAPASSTITATVGTATNVTRSVGRACTGGCTATSTDPLRCRSDKG